MASTSYRADIDGLRAVAVLAILVFHLDPRWLPSGYLGVDVFFVISGYLITGQILAAGARFRFREFYVRRFLRLYPALLATVALTLAAGYVRLAPADLGSLASSGLAAVLGVSNIWFLTDIDYFNPDTAFRPLLHTWSLGVEEQFYLVWPLLLVAVLARAGPLLRIMASVLVLGAALALLAPAWFGSAAAFYLMPFRIHEFALGGLLHLLPGPGSRERAWAGAAAPAGLLLLGGLLALPGTGPLSVANAAAVLPCAATAWIIRCGGHGRNGILAAAPLTRIGRWSYAIYLVHWPLIVFARDLKVVPLTDPDLLALTAASVAAGAALHATVERPLRWRDLRAGLPRMRVAAVAACAAATATAAAVMVAWDGLPHRIARDRVAAAGDLTFAGDLCSARRNLCTFGDRASERIVYLVGDSHALNWVHGLDGLFRAKGIRGIALYDHGCLFLEGTARFVRGVLDKDCARHVEQAYRELARSGAPVILAGAWNGYAGEIGRNDGTLFAATGEAYRAWIEARLQESLAGLARTGRRILLVGLAYDAGQHVPQCLLRPGRPDEAACGFADRAAAAARDGAFDAMLARVAGASPQVTLLHPKDAFCAGSSCIVRQGDGLLLRDTTHLTNAGSNLLVDRARPVLDAWLR